MPDDFLMTVNQKIQRFFKTRIHRFFQTKQREIIAVSMGTVFTCVAGALFATTFLIFFVRPNYCRLILVMANSGDNEKVISVNYEVHGKVQGVFFRKHTNLKARELKLVGWVMNTYHDTVKGNLQGPKSQVLKMKKWLSEVGSPSSRIEKCVFTDEEEISRLEHKGFRIIRQ